VSFGVLAAAAFAHLAQEMDFIAATEELHAQKALDVLIPGSRNEALQVDKRHQGEFPHLVKHLLSEVILHLDGRIDDVSHDLFHYGQPTFNTPKNDSFAIYPRITLVVGPGFVDVMAFTWRAHGNLTNGRLTYRYIGSVTLPDQYWETNKTENRAYP